MRSAAEISLERDDDEGEENLRSRYWQRESEVVVVRVGESVIETTVAYDDPVATKWLRHVQRYHPKRRGPHVASLFCFRGFRFGIWRNRLKGPTANPSHPSNPICAIALCVGGSHCMIYQFTPDLYCNPPRSPKIDPIRDFLGDRKVRVVGIGVRADAEWLERDWGVKVAHPVELRALAAHSFGKEKVWEVKKKGRALVMEGIGLEEMAALALDGMQVEERPAKLLTSDGSDWGNYDISDEMVMYAARDAFLGFEIGLKCFEKIGFPT